MAPAPTPCATPGRRAPAQPEAGLSVLKRPRERAPAARCPWSHSPGLPGAGGLPSLAGHPWRRGRVPHPVLIGHAASLPPYKPDTPRPCPRTNRTRLVRAMARGVQSPVPVTSAARGPQGLNRVQAAPRVGRAMRKILAGVQVSSFPPPHFPTESGWDQPKVLGTNRKWWGPFHIRVPLR